MTFEPSELLEAAVAARDRSYSPYSNFPVGAALIAPDGSIYTGANIENASYGLSMCAERVAVYHAHTQGAREFLAVAVTGPDGILTMPCGACRQVLSEFGPRMQVIYRDGDRLIVTSLNVLLPGAFDGAVLSVAQAAGVSERGLR